MTLGAGEFSRATVTGRIVVLRPSRAIHEPAGHRYVCGARAAFRDLELERLYRDVRTFSLHYRDEQYMVQVGQAMLDGALQPYRARPLG